MRNGRNEKSPHFYGDFSGARGIRTLGGVTPTHDFQSCGSLRIPKWKREIRIGVVRIVVKTSNAAMPQGRGNMIAPQQEIITQDELAGIDPGIRPFVDFLTRHGVYTFESCQSGPGHCFPEPTIRFSGDRAEGHRVLGLAMEHCLPVSHLRRVWDVIDGEPTGPHWELVFYRTAEEWEAANGNVAQGA